MRGIFRGFLGSAALISIAASAADAPKATPPEFVSNSKTVSQYLSDGWELKSTAMGMGGVLMIFSQGKHLALCTVGEKRIANGKSIPATTECYESQN